MSKAYCFSRNKVPTYITAGLNFDTLTFYQKAKMKTVSNTNDSI